MAAHEIPQDGTDHDAAATCQCGPVQHRRRADGGLVYAHTDRRPEGDEREDDCGHVVIDVDGEAQHHEIPGDGAPHAPTSECGCGPQRETRGGEVVYVHVDQDHAEDPVDDEDGGNL